jgi:hypothetical protein
LNDHASPGFYDIVIRWNRIESSAEQESLFRARFSHAYSVAFLQRFRYPPGARSKIFHGFEAYGLLVYVYRFGDLETRLHAEVNPGEPAYVDVHNSVVSLLEDLHKKIDSGRRSSLRARFFDVPGQSSGLTIREVAFGWGPRLSSAFLTVLATTMAWLCVKFVDFEDSGDLENNLFVGFLVSGLLLLLQFLLAIGARRRNRSLRAEVEQNER